VADCLSLPSETFDQFIGNMSRMKMAKYPPAKPGSQGVGPHKDSLSLFTFLSQDHIGGLQVLNKAGQWIDAPPIEGSFVVNIAQGFEAVTGGLCSATTHRVQVSPLRLGYGTSCWDILIYFIVSYDCNPSQYSLLPSSQTGHHF
jgi:isopenicillin N synthase-like dioxygenase